MQRAIWLHHGHRAAKRCVGDEPYAYPGRVFAEGDLTKARSSKRYREKTPPQAGGSPSSAVPQWQRVDQPQDSPTRLGWRNLLPILIIAAGVVAYWNSFDGKLIFDDQRHIVENRRIQQVLPLSKTMGGRRPVVDLSLAINRHDGLEDGELDLWSFHALNLCVHLLAGLTLFGIVRRTMIRGPFDQRTRAAAPWFACIVAIIWIVHPLQTQSVTYLIQRAESMMGLCYLLTLYCVIRGARSRVGAAWYGCAIIACAIGMGCKAVIVTAPLVVLLYDRVFLSKSLLELLKRRWLLYSGLTGSCVVLVVSRVVKGVLAGLLWDPIPQATVGFSVTTVTPWEYLISQPGVIVHYLRLSFWPHPLCLDYQWPVAQRIVEILPPALVIVLLVGATIWGLARKPWAAFVGAWFFVILAPTSSFIPIKDLLFEHRMYLPLAAVIVMVVAVFYQALLYVDRRRPLHAWGRRFLVVVFVVGIVTPLTYGTIRRNVDYHDASSMWRDVIAQRPDNPRAYVALGRAVFARGEQARSEGDPATARQLFNQAEQALKEAVRLDDSFADAWLNLGNVLSEIEKPVEAVAAYRQSLRYRSRNAKVHYNLGNVLKNLKQYDEAIAEYRKAIEYDPEHILAHVNLGNTYNIQGRYEEAISIYNKAIGIDPGHADTHHNLAAAYVALGRYEEALSEFELAIQYDPTHVQAKRARDLVLAKLRQPSGR